MSEHTQPPLFNTPLEAGVRAVIILEAFEPAAFDIATLALLDYFVVHTGDAGGPESIHPQNDSRMGEYFVRRRLVEQGVALMMRASVLEQITDASGISFRAHETASAMLDLMGTSYNRRLQVAAHWLASKAQPEGHTKLIDNLKNKVDRWSFETIGAAHR